MLKRYLKYGFFITCAAYVIIALTPLATEIGRLSPKLAALFRPILFNFVNEYHNGSVLGLEIGQSKAEVARYFVENYNNSYRLFIKDGQIRPVNESFFRPTSESEFIQYLGLKNTLQINMDDSSKLGFILQFSKDKLSAIRVYWVNNGK